MPDLIEAGELRRIARAISTVENQSDGYEQILGEAYRMQHWANVIGVTGPPGAGKSTLVDALTAHWAAAGERVAVLAIDPSSPYSGGAVLGDRIRRTRSAALANTYFRSLSARGHVGGLTETATDLIAVLSLHGFRRVLVETVGAGQADIEIHETADCTLVVTVPGLGDGVQAAKAGLTEIADVFAVNKADLPGAEDAAQTIERSLAAAYMGEPGINARNETVVAIQTRHSDTPGVVALRRRHGDVAVDDTTWVPPVARVVATENTGVPKLGATIDAFITWSDETGRRQLRTRERAYAQVVRALSALLMAPFVRTPGTDEFPAAVADWIDRIAKGAASPREAARALVNDVDR